MKIVIGILLSVMLFSAADVYAQDYLSKEQVLTTVRLKMIQAAKLQELGNQDKAKSLVNESIAIMLTAIRRGESQPWMKQGLRLAMQSNRTPPEDIERIMREVDMYISTVEKRPLTLMEKLNSLENTSATRELARDRKALFFNQRAVLGQRGVGYHPIISILPQGNSMTAGPVILSPDRRYARIGISYSNTSIGAVHSFNFSTGKYQTLNNRE
jgi:hypothetical protein